MDNSQILSMFLRGAMGSRGRKRARKAANFLSGNRGFLTASTVLGAAGIAWGVYETLQNKAGGEFSGVVPAPGGPAAPATPGTFVPPPVPGAAPVAMTPDDRGLPLGVLRVVRLAVSAARSDGALLPAERALILSHARDADVESIVEAELAAPQPLRDIISGVTDDQRKRDLYVLAFAMVRADDNVSGAERVYLAQLAHLLGLDPATAAGLETDTASKIDATSDSPQ